MAKDVSTEGKSELFFRFSAIDSLFFFFWPAQELVAASVIF